MHDVACAIALCVDPLRELIMNVITQNESESAIEQEAVAVTVAKPACRHRAPVEYLYLHPDEMM